MTDPKIQKASEDMLEKYREQSEARHQEIMHLAQLNQEHARELELTATTSYTITGQVNFATAFIYGTVEVVGSYTDSGQGVRFYSQMWGVGFGGGTGAIVCTMNVPADQLVGNASFQMNSASVGGGGVQITWWNDKGYLGVGVAASLAIGASVTGGSGEWSYH